MELYTWDTNNPYFLGKWRALFAGVNRANAVIDLINNSENPADFTTELAQARFLRGHYNFELTRMWVNVPYISDENFAAAEFNQPNSGPLWSEIDEDFSFAVANLPASRGGNYSEPGRPIQTTARAYLGKSKLYQGNWGEALSNLCLLYTSDAADE